MRSVHEGMNHITKVKVHLRTRNEKLTSPVVHAVLSLYLHEGNISYSNTLANITRCL